MAACKRVFGFISSMKTGLILLALIGLISALGSGFLPDSFFRTPLFKALLLLLFINMALCTVSQISRYLKHWNGGRKKSQVRFRQVGLILLHAGVVVILIGGTISSYYEHSVDIKVVEGRTVDLSKVIKTKQPFLLKLNKFKITFNADGSPSQYYSYVSTVEPGQANQNYCISVNHPLKYEGLKVYQESFGYLVKVEGEYGKGSNLTQSVREGDFFTIPGTPRSVKVYKYIPNFDPAYGMDSKTLRPDNPRVIFSVYEKGQLLGVGAARFDKRIEIDHNVFVKFNGLQPLSVLKVKSDPSLPWIGTGGLMLMVGVCLALILNPNGKKKTRVLSEPDLRQEEI